MPGAAKARISRSGRIDSRPIGEYSMSNSAESDLSAALAICRNHP
jgi:hypothetical protein